MINMTEYMVIENICSYFGTEQTTDEFYIEVDGRVYQETLLECCLNRTTKNFNSVIGQEKGVFVYRIFGNKPFSEFMTVNEVPFGYSKEEFFYMYPLPGNNNNSFDSNYVNFMYNVKLPKIRKKYPKFPLFFENFDGKVYACLLLKASDMLYNFSDYQIIGVLDVMKKILEEF